jgi:hypothetical protein
MLCIRTSGDFGEEIVGKGRAWDEGNIRTHRKEIGLDGVDWIDLAQGRDRLRVL